MFPLQTPAPIPQAPAQPSLRPDPEPQLHQQPKSSAENSKKSRARIVFWSFVQG